MAFMRKINFIICISFILNLFQDLQSQEHYPQNFATENGVISKLLQSNDTLFGAGIFYIGGYEVGSLIRYLGDNRSELDPGMPYIDNGTIKDAVSDGNGGWYIAIGSAITYNGIPRRGVVHIDSDNQLDEDFILTQNSSFGGSINVLLLHNDILYVGGGFDGYAGSNQVNLLAYNVNTGQIIESWDCGFSYTSMQFVSSLAVHNNNLIVGGVLLSNLGQPINNLGMFSLTDGSFVADLNANGEVKRIIIDADTAYVGGAFTTMNSSSRNFFAKINLSDISLMPMAANFNSTVYDFKINGDDVYAGGWFTTVNGSSRTGLVKMNRYSGEVDAEMNPILDQPRVACLDIVNENLIIGGNFMQVNNVGREKLAQVDKNTGALSTWNSSVASIPEGIKSTNGNLLIYGDMNQMQREIRYSFFALKLPERTLLPIAFNSADFSVGFRDMVKYGNKIIFSTSSNYQINGVSSGLLFAYDLQTQEIQSFGTFGGLANPTVDRLLILDDKLFVSGYFTQVNGESRNRIAQFNLDDYSLNSWNPAPEYSFAARTMKVHNGKLFMAGFITQTQTTTQYVACALNLSDASWAGGLLRDPASGISYSGNDILISGNSIFLAGSQFMSFTPFVQSAVLKMNEQFEVDANFIAQMSENSFGSESITMINDVLVAFHRTSQNTRSLYFHSPLNGDSLLNLPIVFEGSAPFILQIDLPTSFILDSDILYIGGNWNSVNGNTVRGLAVIDGRDVSFPGIPTSLEPEIEIHDNNSESYVFPNPANDFVYFKALSSTYNLQITDLNGKLIHQEEVFDNRQLNVAHIPSGFYQITVTDQGKVFHQKLIIQH